MTPPYQVKPFSKGQHHGKSITFSSFHKKQSNQRHLHHIIPGIPQFSEWGDFVFEAKTSSWKTDARQSTVVKLKSLKLGSKETRFWNKPFEKIVIKINRTPQVPNIDCRIYFFFLEIKLRSVKRSSWKICCFEVSKTGVKVEFRLLSPNNEVYKLFGRLGTPWVELEINFLRRKTLSAWNTDMRWTNRKETQTS